MSRLSLLFILLACAFSAHSQEFERCLNTIQSHEERLEEDEEYRLRNEIWRKAISKIIADRNGRKNPDCSNGPIIIPVAIHYDSGIVPAGQEACAIDVAVDQINEMNNEIAGLDADAFLINNFTSCFGAGILGNACIEFCIGQYGHPSGYGLVDGDYAVTIGQVSFNVPSGNFTPVNSDWDEYINIYVDNLPGGLLGVSNGIPGNFNGDGVLVDNCVWGTGAINCPGANFTGSGSCFSTYDEGETTAHELGHYLGLFHIWGDNFSCGGSQDQIADTPNMANNYSGYLSCGSHSSCSDLPQTCSSEDMYMNFMSYAGDGCMYMFTSDQSDVMNATAVFEGFTTSSPKCLPPPVADFTPNGPVALCNTDCISYNDASQNFPDSWEWSFQVTAGNIAIDISSSTDQNPTVCVTSGTNGTIRSGLIATNGAGSDSEIKFIDVSYASNMTYYADTDGDDFGDPNNSLIDCEQPSGYVLDNTDCDDSNSNVYPGNTEICDGIDNDCDNVTDEGCALEDCDGDFLVINSISQNTYRAEFNIMSDALIDNGQSVLYAAGTDIDLDPGFEVATGTGFDALIDDCAPLMFIINGEKEQFELLNLSFADFEEKLSIKYDQVDPGSIKIYGLDGKLQTTIGTKDKPLFDHLKQADLTTGVYWLTIEYGQDTVVRKIIISQR